MARSTLIAWSLVVALLLPASEAIAWGYEGHEVVGSIADQMLSPHARERVASFLGLELRVAGPWADCVRSVKRLQDGSFKYLPDPAHPEYRVPCTAFETAAEVARMEDYARRNWDTCPHQPGHACHEWFHFADVAIQHDHYDRSYKGTSDQDIVSAINAAIAVLQGHAAPIPFSIKDEKEALLMLAHFVGDVHQPLHVGVVYLQPDGTLVNPDALGTSFNEKMDTAGGNFIEVIDGHRTNFHAEWDRIPSSLGTLASSDLVQRARSVSHSSGRLQDWASAWASDTILVARRAFAGVSFTADPTRPGRWISRFQDRNAYAMRDGIQTDQLTRAGARLSELLDTIWP